MFFDGGGFFRTGPGSNSFDVKYKCYPVAFLNRDDLEQGNKCLLPASALGEISSMDVSWPVMFKAENPRASAAGQPRKHTHVGVHEFVAEEGTCYLPMWVMQNLGIAEGEFVRIQIADLPRARSVKLQPESVAFLDIPNPRVMLEHSLRFYSALTVGDLISLHHNGKVFRMEVTDCQPARAVGVVETDVSVDFDPPKDYVEPTAAPVPEKDVDLVQEMVEEKFEAGQVFGGAGARVDGKKLRTKQTEAWKEAALADIDQRPWAKAYPHGCRSVAPYGYGEGHNSGATRHDRLRQGLTRKTGGGQNAFEGAGRTLKG